MAIISKTEKLIGYGAYHSCESKVYYPKNIVEMQDFLLMANKQGLTFSIKGAGLSIDAQFLNKTVVSTEEIKYVQLNIEKQTVTVGAGTSWGTILQTILPFGFTIESIPSASKITAGGTISACSISRLSPSFGTSGNLIESFQLLTVENGLLTCSLRENRDLFLGAICGWGYLGIVCEITYKMTYIGPNPKLYTVARRFEVLKDLHQLLQPQYNFDEEETNYWAGAGSTIFTHKDKVRVIVSKHRLGSTTEEIPFLLHQHSFIRNIGDFMLRTNPRFANFMWNATYNQFGKRIEARYIDDLYNATFFMESNLGTKSTLDKCGLKFGTMQETYFLPFTQYGQGEETAITIFITKALEKLKEYNLKPAMFDALHVAAGQPFVLSSNQGQKGFLTSIVFEGNSVQKMEYMKQFFKELQLLCLSLGGRLHLTKNALVEPEILSEMYKDVLPKFAKLKEKYDPQGLLKNEFFLRIFPNL